jgi:hypothetical protein
MGAFVGGLFITYIFARLFLFVLRRWKVQIWLNILAANLASVFALSLIFSLVSGRGSFSGPDFIGALIQYALPQLCWLAFGIIKHRKILQMTVGN